MQFTPVMRIHYLVEKSLLRSIAHLSIHVSETRKEVANCFKKSGMYPVEYLDSIDFFIPERTICAHGSWVKKSEMRTMAERRAILAHCPSSNMARLWRDCIFACIQGSRS